LIVLVPKNDLLLIWVKQALTNQIGLGTISYAVTMLLTVEVLQEK